MQHKKLACANKPANERASATLFGPAEAKAVALCTSKPKRCKRASKRSAMEKNNKREQHFSKALLLLIAGLLCFCYATSNECSRLSAFCAAHRTRVVASCLSLSICFYFVLLRFPELRAGSSLLLVSLESIVGETSQSRWLISRWMESELWSIRQDSYRYGWKASWEILSPSTHKDAY